MKLLIKNGTVVSLRDGLFKRLDVLCEDGRISDIAPKIKDDGAEVIDARGLYVSAGLVDLFAKAFEPEREGEEDLLSLCHAASKGGFTTLCVHTDLCDIEQLKYIHEREEYCSCALIPAARATDGKELLYYGDFKLFGAGAVYDDEPITDPLLMRDALFRARKYEIPLLVRCKENAFYGDGLARRGLMADLMDMPSIPSCSETVPVARDVVLASDSGSPVHIGHISCTGSIELVRRAKADNVKVTCSTEPYYFSLTSRELQGFNTLAKLDPPLANKDDVQAVIEGIRDGTVDAIASGHAPCTDHSKRMSLVSAPYGASGVETALSAAITYLYHGAKIELPKVLDLMTAAPAEILGINAGRLRKGDIADLCIFDTEHEYVVRGSHFISRGHNTPFEGKKLRGAVRYTVKDGRISFQTNE
ncbi:MAG: dihydroorotase [Clostridia bacterium]|nr:dihydroorotase [Clostridia bacterium]